jgi:nitroimidazol reductase NimA-like FMN-containing flavoprotein (pyridoxamine 5'-phosphate oxidase superfamily)
MSVIVFGRYEELRDQPEFLAARTMAHEQLQRRAVWWEPAYVGAEHRDIPHSFTPIFYRIGIQRMTGHRATPNGARTLTNVGNKHSWFGKILNRLGLTDKQLPTQ